MKSSCGARDPIYLPAASGLPLRSGLYSSQIKNSFASDFRRHNDYIMLSDKPAYFVEVAAPLGKEWSEYCPCIPHRHSALWSEVITKSWVNEAALIKNKGASNRAENLLKVIRMKWSGQAAS